MSASRLSSREVDGTTRDLTPGEKVKAGFDGWSADGKSFYVQTNERDPAAFDLYRYATDGYERTLVFRNNDALAIAAESPDGGKVAMVKPRTSADSDISLLDTAAAEARKSGGEGKRVTVRAALGGRRDRKKKKKQ